MPERHPWWQDAVIYQVYLRSFADANGDGIGDLTGLAHRLPYIASLGVDGIWLNPCYPSPQRDHGYDIADYVDVEPAYGTLKEFDALVEQAHGLGLKVLLDMVANHCSSEHEWFQKALVSPPGSPERARFLFRDGRGPCGVEPPNDWQSVFGGPAWTRVLEPDGKPGQWYLHLFDPGQPDFDWRNADVQHMFEEVLRFWFDRGVDGFRLDVAHGLVKHPELADWPDADASYNRHMWDRPEVHDIYRRWRSIADEYAGRGRDVVFVAEVWVPEADRLARYVRPDELHQAFYFDLLGLRWEAADFQAAIARGIETCGPMPTWTLANHDVHRTVTRLGTTPAERVDTGADLVAAARVRGEVDLEVGDRRARAALLLSLALPGAVYLYQGEELGLPEVLHLPDDARQDPIWHRSAGTEPGRDGCRVPLPWRQGEAAFGFSPPGAPEPWLPQPEWFASYAVDAQDGVVGSFLTLSRKALGLRQPLWGGIEQIDWLTPVREPMLAFARGRSVCVVNFSDSAVELPTEWGDLSLCSHSGAAKATGRILAPDAACWLRRR
jgi:alpha-glucosidase